MGLKKGMMVKKRGVRSAARSSEARCSFKGGALGCAEHCMASCRMPPLHGQVGFSAEPNHHFHRWGPSIGLLALTDCFEELAMPMSSAPSRFARKRETVPVRD